MEQPEIGALGSMTDNSTQKKEIHRPFNYEHTDPNYIGANAYIHTRGSNPRCPIMKPDTYDGSGTLEDFLSHFEVLAELNNWDVNLKAKYLATSLRGAAQGVLSDMSRETRGDFGSLVATLKRRFGNENQVDLFRAQLRSYRRNKGSSLPEMSKFSRVVNGSNRNI